jgi:hypothetical protein
MIYHGTFLKRAVLNKFRKIYHEGLTLYAKKYNFGAIAHLKFRMTRELLPAPPNIFPKPYTICPIDLI